MADDGAIMTRWLTEDEQRSWRAWVAATTLLPDRLSRDLQEKWGYSITDYIILMALSESPGRKMRMSDLADATLASRSRLSHQVDRLGKDGLVTREPCVDDRRGSFAVLTPAGMRILEHMAADHVDGVRNRLVDLLTPEEFAELGRLCQKVADGLGPGASDWWQQLT